MLKVFLVEDEYVVREGIKNNIDWLGHGFEFCGQAGDGELAYPMILDLEPDIIVTDIKMPFMDGLELTRLVRSTLPHTRIIILSGHEEFQYAREAIKLGVSEYLLKPINGGDLLESIKLVADSIMVERNENVYLKRYQEEMEENVHYQQGIFFKKIMESQLTSVEIFEKGKELGLNLHGLFFKVVIIKSVYKGLHNADDIEGENATRLSELLRTLENVNLIEKGIAGDVFLIKADSEDGLEHRESIFLNQYRKITEEFGIELTGGIGLVVNRISDIGRSYHEAEKAYASRFAYSDDEKSIGQIYDARNRMRQIQDRNLVFDAHELGNVDFKKTDLFLKQGSLPELDGFVDDLIKSIEEVSRSLLFTQYILMNLYLSALTFVEGFSEEEVFLKKHRIDEGELQLLASRPASIRPFIRSILETVIELRNKRHEDKYTSLIDMAKTYIHENYIRDDLSLHDLANHVGLSPNHFSSIFSNTTGKSFIRYLTDVRVGEAKTLLKCTDMRCSNIAQKVGYKDPHYFSFLFKKEEGLSPMQYRGENHV